VEVLQEVIRLLKPKLKTNEITLTDNTATARFRVSADAGHLKQLFMNLLINAIEAMPDGGEMTLNTSLQTGPELPDGNSGIKYLALSIMDSGPGLPGKVIEHLFEPVIKGNDQGVGLGLSISQNIASIHKGWIEGKNNPEGAGAIFHIFLPLIIED
jgi:signal transduction histidine kinase